METTKQSQKKRVAVLQARRERHLDATYLVLVKALVSCKKVQQASKVCKQVFKQSHPNAGESETLLLILSAIQTSQTNYRH